MKAGKVRIRSDRAGHVVVISSNISGGVCRVCAEGLSTEEGRHFEQNVNHYLGHQGCRLLHVGQETHHDMDANPWQTTVAIIALVSTSRSK